MSRPWFQAGPIQPDQRIIQVVVPRSNERTMAIVQALVPKDFGGDEEAGKSDTAVLFGHVCNAVTEWIRESPKGEQELRSSHFDFNVGDLANAIAPEMTATSKHEGDDLETYLRKHEILALHVETF